MSRWLGLEGARVLIAGAGGLGVAVATGFVEAGARVTVVDRDEARFQHVRAIEGFESSGGTTCQVDLLQPGAAAGLLQHLVDAQGGIDVLVHCIGINDRRPILEITDDDWTRVLDVNLRTAFAIAQEAGRVMVAQKSGRIVFFSSVSGRSAHKNHGPYAASKAGLNQMMKVMAAEWASSGVGLNAVAPGYVETPLTAHHLQQPGVREGLERLVPAGRLGVPDEIVGSVLFLSSQRASFVTGQVLYVDGGRTLV